MYKCNYIYEWVTVIYNEVKYILEDDKHVEYKNEIDTFIIYINRVYVSCIYYISFVSYMEYVIYIYDMM